MNGAIIPGHLTFEQRNDFPVMNETNMTTENQDKLPSGEEGTVQVESEQMLPVSAVVEESGNPDKDPAAKKKKKKKSKKIPEERGIQTMLRISSANNVRVSVMADNKAHIMIGVNSVTISVIFALVAKNLEEQPFLLIPTALLLVVNVLTIVLSILATRPKIPDGKFTKNQVDGKSVNLLYFGSYYGMPFETYNTALKKLMDDSEFLYESMRKDLYWQGRTLGRKYRLLRMAYSIFMYGFIAAVIAFVMSYLLHYYA